LLGSALRVVTVFEPVLPDLRDPNHFTRNHGPAIDPELYLKEVTSELAPDAITAAIGDAVSVAAGLGDYLRGSPAQLLLLGGHNHAPFLGRGTTADVLQTVQLPVLVVNHE
jgi:hypothetical protein